MKSQIDRIIDDVSRLNNSCAESARISERERPKDHDVGDLLVGWGGVHERALLRLMLSTKSARNKPSRHTPGSWLYDWTE